MSSISLNKNSVVLQKLCKLKVMTTSIVKVSMAVIHYVKMF